MSTKPKRTRRMRRVAIPPLTAAQGRMTLWAIERVLSHENGLASLLTRYERRQLEQMSKILKARGMVA